MKIIEVKDLTKIFDSGRFSKSSVTALKGLTLSVEQGKIFGLLGPNGAGKTTLVKILLGITHPTIGSVKLFDRDVSDYKIRMKMGYLPENHKFPEYLTAFESLVYLGRLSGIKYNALLKKIDFNLKLVDLEKWKKIKVKKFSKGMLQRLGIAQALINDPELIFLDEPTDGVDPIGRKDIRDILINLKNEGKTILLNSHLLSEVELVCDNVAILHNGVLVKEGNIEELTVQTNKYNFLTSEIGDIILTELLNNYKAIISSKTNFSVVITDINELNLLIDYLRGKKILIHTITKEKDTLEDLFINLIEQKENLN
jgi:ABC-2 type transport system ATP-binding protein